MAISRIFLWLSFALLFYAALMITTAVSGVILGEFEQARMFFMLSCLVAVAGLIIYYTSHNAPRRESPRDALVFLVLFWIFLPVITALPYFLTAGTGPHSWVVSYFESVSAITTTGASTQVPEELPRTMLLWRSALQWSGGCIVATFAVVVFAAINLDGTGVHKSVLFTLKRGELFSRLVSIGRKITVLYAIVAAICILFLIWFGTPAFEAVCLGLSAVSTGGLTPRSGPLAPYVSHLGGFVLALTCILGALNVSVIWELFRRRNLNAVRETAANVEHRGLLVMISILLVIGFIYTGPMHAVTVMIESAFMATTTGFDYHVIGVDIIPPSILIALVLIGGSALSTAGGLKIIRMLLLFRHLRTDLDRMSHPSRVMPVRFEGEIVPDKAFLSVWMYFFGYTLVFALGIMALGAAGLDFTTAVAACASMLSNMGPLLAATTPETGYGDMNSLELAVLTVIMIVGRVEVLAAFAIVSPSFWWR